MNRYTLKIVFETEEVLTSEQINGASTALLGDFEADSGMPSGAILLVQIESCDCRY